MLKSHAVCHHGVLLAILWLMGACQSFAAPVNLAPDKGSYSLHGHLAVMFDETGLLGIDDIRQLPDESFAPVPGDFNGGYTKAVAWLRFTLKRDDSTSAGPWWLHVGPSFIDSITLFAPASSGTPERQEFALSGPWSARPLKDRSAVFPVTIAETDAQTFHLRIQNTSALAASVTLWHPEEYTEWVIRDAFLLGGYLITASVIVLINLFYWWNFRQRLFPAYIGYVAVMALHTLQKEGLQLFLGQLETPPDVKFWQTLTQLTLIWCASWLFLALVRPERFWPRLVRVYLFYCMSMLAVGTILTFLGHHALVIPWGWMQLLFLLWLHICVCVFLILRKDRHAFYYLASFLGLILTATLNLLNAFGVIEGGFAVDYGMLIGTIVHWVLIQMAVLGIINRAKREHEQARDDALNVTRQAKADLEAKIQIRTRELNAAVAALQHEVTSRTRLAQDLEQARFQLEQAFDAEQQANVAQHQFLRMVAHEFRTPLTTIQSVGIMLEDRCIDDDALYQRALERMNGATQHMLYLVNEALRMGLFEGSAWRGNAAEVNIHTLLKEIAAYATSVYAKSQDIVVDCEDLYIQGDRDLLRIAIHNLVDNAQKYSPSCSVIRIEAQRMDAKNIIVSVHDEGPGINSHELRLIFGKYYRPENSCEAGLGLGLHLVDHISRLHGGRVEVKSVLGQGSSFSLFLPVR